MSQLIWIGSSEHIDFIRNKLGAESKLLQAEGVVLNIGEVIAGSYTFWGIEVPLTQQGVFRNEGSLFSFRYSLAKLITDLILIKYEDKLLKTALKNQCYYFNQDEQAFILEKCKEILEESSFLRRKNSILQSVVEYIEEEKILILDGFIRFRLKGYLEELKDVVEQAVEEYLMEKEYSDFVLLLKYFVEIQEPKMDMVNVLIQRNGFFQLYDSEDNVIKSEYLENFIIELADNELNYEDLLISTLITLAPQRIILHVPDPGSVAGTVSTIESVFENRVSLCNGCRKCSNTKQQHKKT